MTPSAAAADSFASGADTPPGGLPSLRLVLAVSLDGRLAPPAGGAAQIGGPADRRVLEEALAWADGCLIGAGTLRLHGSTCLIHAPDLLEARRRAGLSPQPVAVAVSCSGHLPAGLPFFRQPLERWWLGGAAVADAAAPGDPALPTPCGVRRGAEDPRPGFARQLPLDDWPTALVALARFGLRRIVVLGGARLASGLLAEGLVEEIQLTLCPQLLGGPHLWLPPEGPLPIPSEAAGWRLSVCRPLQGHELLLRYSRSPQGASSSPG